MKQLLLTILRVIAITLMMASIPTVLITIVWLVTIGSFNLLDVLHSPAVIVVTGILCATGFIMSLAGLVSLMINTFYTL